jgi:glucose/arabinose dehydrogenase
VYIADRNGDVVRAVGADGIISTFAGTGVAGFSGDGGPATAAQLFAPWGVAVGNDGTVFVTDAANSRVRAVGPDGIISTFAGTGVAEFGSDGQPALMAAIDFPAGVAVGRDGTVYIAAINNNRIRTVGSRGEIGTLAGTG